jgi:GT2 family glycosyltransferase
MMGAGHEDQAARRSTAPQGELNYDLAVAYRIYPKVSMPAQSLPFGGDKLRQAEICLRSFRNSLGSLRVKVWAILDGCPEEYQALFQRYFAPEDLVLVGIDGIGNRATYAKQIELLLLQRDAEFVYFAEDDYLYLPNQFPLMLKFLRERRRVDFVTPYDHPDCYQLDLHHEPKWVTVFEGNHWRTAASTCLTFLTRRSTLAKYERTLSTYSRGNDDCAMWLSLTKRRVFQPLAMLRFFAKGELYCLKIFVKAWSFCWPQIVFGKAAQLWVPLPGLATHLCAGLFSPGIDWLALMQQSADGVEVGEVTAVKQVARSATGALGSLEMGDSDKTARVVVLLLNWNNWKDTNECLASLRGLDYGNWRVLVLDNGSTDDSVRCIRERFPDAEIMELGANLGYAKGNNAGIRAALKCGADYVWLLNNDTRVDGMSLRALVEKAEADPRIGAVGSAIYRMADPERLQAWGGDVNFWLGRSRHFLMPVADERIQFLTGASLLLRRSVLESVGALDEGYFFYWEDADYCFRIRRAGWRLAVAGNSRVWHKEAATASKNIVKSDLDFTKSAVRFFRRNAPLPALSLAVGTGLRLVKRAMVGDWERCRAVWGGAKAS